MLWLVRARSIFWLGALSGVRRQILPSQSEHAIAHSPPQLPTLAQSSVGAAASHYSDGCCAAQGQDAQHLRSTAGSACGDSALDHVIIQHQFAPLYYH
jgi:hypothetical protein